MEYYLRGQLAKAAGIHSETLRYYEKIGLLCVNERTGSGYRLYPEELLNRLEFIKYAKEAGYTLAEIKQLLYSIENRLVDRSYVEQQIDLKTQKIESKIEKLLEIKEVLKAVKAKLNDPTKKTFLQTLLNVNDL